MPSLIYQRWVSLILEVIIKSTVKIKHQAFTLYELSTSNNNNIFLYLKCQCIKDLPCMLLSMSNHLPWLLLILYISVLTFFPSQLHCFFHQDGKTATNLSGWWSVAWTQAMWQKPSCPFSSLGFREFAASILCLLSWWSQHMKELILSRGSYYSPTGKCVVRVSYTFQYQGTCHGT